MASNVSREISNMTSQQFTNVVPPSMVEETTWSTKLLIALACIAALAGIYQFRSYFSYIQPLVEMVRSVLTTAIDLASATSTNVVDGTAKGSEVVVKKISGVKKEEPTPDESNSTTQKKNTGGYCYLGEWKGLRSCARVGAEDCTSGEMFGSKELCMNPELR
jgi:hypothetical protein